MQRPLCWLTVVLCASATASCYAQIEGSPVAGEVARRTFYETCAGSTFALDGNSFLVLGGDAARAYARDGEPRPLRTALAPIIAAASTADAARVGENVFVVDTTRFTALAVDTLATVGTSTALLADASDATTWAAPPNPVAIDTLRLAVAGGVASIEGLAFAPSVEQPSRLWVGLQRPLVHGHAIAVSLLQPNAFVAGSRARFGEAALLDLGGVGIRGMAYSDALASVFVLAGPIEPERFRLFRWSGNAGDAPAFVVDVAAPAAGAVAQSIVAYSQSAEIQIVFDMSDSVVNESAPCRSVEIPDRSFQDVVVRVD